MVGKRFWFYAGVFLLCMSTLMLQIIQTRILSVVSFYYLGFFSISMAMLGMTVGALLVYFDPFHLKQHSLSHNLTRICLAYALSIAICFAFQLTAVAIFVRWASVLLIWLKLILLIALPFIFAGMATSLALTRSPYPVRLVYGADLVGAALGCLGVIVLLNFMDAPSAIFAVAAVAALAATCFSQADAEAEPATKARGILGRPLIVTLALLVLSIGNSMTSHGLQPIGSKWGIENRENFEIEKWNSFSRIVAHQKTHIEPFLWGASPLYVPAGKIDQHQLDIDGFAGTTMPRFSGDLKTLSFLQYDVTNLAYSIRHTGRSAVVGVGSGRDLLSAYYFGMRDVTGVDVNPIFIDFLTNPSKLRGFSGLADLPGIHFDVDEGRSWFARTKQHFDLIQMSMIDTFAATGAGAFSLSENGLYTVEGWRTFLSALTPNGVFTVSRWHSPNAPVEIGRLVSLASSTLFSLGANDPQNHIFLASAGKLATIVVSRAPLSPADVQGLTETSQRLGFKILAAPGQVSSVPVFAELLAAHNVKELDQVARRQFLDMSAPTDSRPYFFNQLRITQPAEIISLIKTSLQTREFLRDDNLVVSGNLLALATLSMIIILSAIVVIMVVLWPARSAMMNGERPLVSAGTSYFLLIGLGFMFVEIAFIQRLSVFLGHPTYALGVALFSLIISTGLGSFLSGAVKLEKTEHIMFWFGGLCLYIASLPFWVESVFGLGQSSGLFVRAMISVAIIAPPGLVMGLGFPYGMRLVNQIDPRPTPWFWGVNGAAGVLASGLAVAISLAFSIDTTTILGGFCYLVLCLPALSLLKLSKAATEPSTEVHAHAAASA